MGLKIMGRIVTKKNTYCTYGVREITRALLKILRGSRVSLGDQMMPTREPTYSVPAPLPEVAQ